MFPIVHKRQLSDAVFEFGVEAPALARKVLAGQFLMLRVDETGERVRILVRSKAHQDQARRILARVGVGALCGATIGSNDGMTLVGALIGVAGAIPFAAQEANNVKFSTAMKIGPDLIESSTVVPTIAGAGLPARSRRGARGRSGIRACADRALRFGSA